MTLRARLIDMYEIGMANDSFDGGKERMADKAALRELDELLERCANLMENHGEFPITCERLRQAGYGEKQMEWLTSEVLTKHDRAIIMCAVAVSFILNIPLYLSFLFHNHGDKRK